MINIGSVTKYFSIIVIQTKVFPDHFLPI